MIDANVVSEMMRPHPEPRVSAFLDSVGGEGLRLSSVTVWEILDGIGPLPAGRRRYTLAERFHDLLDHLFEDRIVDWSETDARTCARIMEEKRQRGEPLDDHIPDAFLAAAVASRGLGVLTRNTGEFRNTGIESVNPWAAAPR
ncbi:MAG: PIN domain-containing protein [Gammaproteobacteria bacterium]|nr:PIN domain-containing protein [Gammaproteobacteria bacterium]